MGKLRIVYMGSPDFAIPALTRLAATHNVRAVYTQPPRRSGRGMQEQPVPLAQYALGLNLPVYWPVSLQDATVQRELASHDADLFIVVAYGLLLPQAVLDIPRYGCLNGHASLLPRWRGAAPIQRAIEAGDHETGISVMLMEAGLDTGPVLATRRTSITSDTNAGNLHGRLASMNAALLDDTIGQLDHALLHRTAQNHALASYARKIASDDTHIDWQKTAPTLACHIRAYAPYPGAWFAGSKSRIRVLAAHPVSAPDNKALYPNQLTNQLTNQFAGQFAGQDSDGHMLVVTGDGILCITRVQPAGKKSMSAKSFLNGVQMTIGTHLSVDDSA